MVETTRGRRKAATREELRRAARTCFADRGYAATNVGDISAAAGVAHGTFYVHFAAKEAVLDDLLAELNRELASRLAPVLAGLARAGLGATVHAAAEVFIDFCRQEEKLVACYLERAAGGLDPAAFREGVNPPVRALLSAALRAAGRPEVDDQSLDLVAHGLLAMWLRVALRHLFGGGTRQVTVDLLTGMTLGVLRGVLGDEVAS